MDKVIDFKYENELSQSTFDDFQPDIVITLGGGNTFLKASAIINNPITPILGVRTTSALFQGSFTKVTVTEKQRTKNIPAILEALDCKSSST